MLLSEASALFFVVADLCNAAVLAWDSFFAMYTYRNGLPFLHLMGPQWSPSEVEPMYQYSLEWFRPHHGTNTDGTC